MLKPAPKGRLSEEGLSMLKPALEAPPPPPPYSMGSTSDMLSFKSKSAGGPRDVDEAAFEDPACIESPLPGAMGGLLGLGKARAALKAPPLTLPKHAAA